MKRVRKSIVLLFILMLGINIYSMEIKDKKIIDNYGNSIEQREYRKIVVLDPAVVETFYMLGGESKILRLPSFEGRRAAGAVPPPRAAGRGACRAARPPAGTQAAGLCEERPGKRPVAVPCGSPEEPQDRPASGAGRAHPRRCGAVRTINSGGNYGRNSLHRGDPHRQSGGYAAPGGCHL